MTDWMGTKADGWPAILCMHEHSPATWQWLVWALRGRFGREHRSLDFFRLARSIRSVRPDCKPGTCLGFCSKDCTADAHMRWRMSGLGPSTPSSTRRRRRLCPSEPPSRESTQSVCAAAAKYCRVGRRCLRACALATSATAGFLPGHPLGGRDSIQTRKRVVILAQDKSNIGCKGTKSWSIVGIAIWLILENKCFSLLYKIFQTEVESNYWSVEFFVIRLTHPDIRIAACRCRAFRWQTMPWANRCVKISPLQGSFAERALRMSGSVDHVPITQSPSLTRIDIALSKWHCWHWYILTVQTAWANSLAASRHRCSSRSRRWEGHSAWLRTRKCGNVLHLRSNPLAVTDFRHTLPRSWTYIAQVDAIRARPTFARASDSRKPEPHSEPTHSINICSMSAVQWSLNTSAHAEWIIIWWSVHRHKNAHVCIKLAVAVLMFACSLTVFLWGILLQHHRRPERARESVFISRPPCRHPVVCHAIWQRCFRIRCGSCEMSV